MRIFATLVRINHRLYHFIMTASSKAHSNLLIHESSPYLLQHAYNPVDWRPFGEAAFEEARRRGVPLLISVGYSACHWCHVMEHESFEDLEVAALMNQYFVNVKVNREERSDVDQLYMQAVQLMTGHGGWPLNCFVMPDGSPFYGGTYFPKDRWTGLLNNLNRLWAEQPEKVKAYAQELTEGIHKSELLVTVDKEQRPLSRLVLKESVTRWKSRMDNEEGGPDKAPKFPLPNNYLFLLRYALLEKDDELMGHVDLTLRKMAFGGLYDQLHGGFCRYSTDRLWKVPHFEKMLYDNAQLASLYLEAFQVSDNLLYKKIAVEVLSFVEKEWWQEDGYFFSALDADSDGEEGKFYVWTEADLKDVLGEHAALFSRYYLINEQGYWEHGNYILMRREDISEVLTDTGLTAAELDEKMEHCKELLKQEVRSRIKPGLDDKMITSWNAMMCSAFARAWLALDNPHYKELALKNAQFIKNTMMNERGELLRTFKNGKARIAAFLEDYALVIEAWTQVYVMTGQESWLWDARTLLEKALKDFENPKSDLLYYTAVHAAELVTRTSEVADNVTPASNSQMALNLYYLGKYFGKEDWISRSERMLSLVTEDFKTYGAAYSNWGCLALHLNYPFREVAIVGKNVDEIFGELRHHKLTNTIFALSASASELALLKDRYQDMETLIYICENNTCGLPVKTAKEALRQLD